MRLSAADLLAISVRVCVVRRREGGLGLVKLREAVKSRGV
jgi:hypothetical protein